MKKEFWTQLFHRLPRPSKARVVPFTYVALGDSTVEGIGASKRERTYAHTIYEHLKLRFKNVRYENFGKGGARVANVLREQIDRAVEANPDLVTISIGANDVVRHTRVRSYRRQLTMLIERLQQETSALIVITNIPNFSALRVVPRPLKPIVKFRIARLNACILAIADTHDIVHVDTYQQSTVIARQFPEAIYSDGFHPSDLGYALWANTIVTSLEHKLPLIRPNR